MFSLAEILPRVFGIGEEQLTVMTRDHNYSVLQEYGGACIIIFESKFDFRIYGQPIKACLSSLKIRSKGSQIY